MTIKYKIGEKDTRPWGEWHTTDVGETYIVKKIIVKPHSKLSLQKHTYRDEHWIIAKGSGLVRIGNNTVSCHANEHFFICKNTLHRIENNTDNELVFIEIQTGELLDENDIIRLEDIYNRV